MAFTGSELSLQLQLRPLNDQTCRIHVASNFMQSEGICSDYKGKQCTLYICLVLLFFFVCIFAMVLDSTSAWNPRVRPLAV